jgi:hypothetical protein
MQSTAKPQESASKQVMFSILVVRRSFCSGSEIERTGSTRAATRGPESVYHAGLVRW